MSNSNPDPRIKIFIIIAAILVIGGIIVGVMSSNGDKENATGIPKMKIDSIRYNFGTISMTDGLARHNFSIKNEGDGNLIISGIQTSCMCTTAVLKVDGKNSPTFGMHSNALLWSQELKPNQEATLEIIFDPNAHGPDATGPITRTVTMLSNNNNIKNQKTNFIFNANVVK